MTTVSDVLTRAAALLDKGVCRGANARLAGGKACGVFDRRAASHSMYGALCAVLGPDLGDDKALQHSTAWPMIAIRAWEAVPQDQQIGVRMEHALHELNDKLIGFGMTVNTRLGDLFRAWAADPDIKAMGEWR